MNKVVKFGLSALAALALSSTLSNSTAQGRLVFEGNYAVKGNNPDGSPYSGTMNIALFGDGYKITQNFSGSIYRAIASNVGDYLAAASVNSGVPQVTLYRVSAPNTLSGYWQDYDNNQEGAEDAILGGRFFSFVPSAPVANTWNYAGTYSVRGNAPDGTTYTGAMQLSVYGSGYRASFSSGGQVWRGIGSYIGNYFAIAWNAGGVASVTIYEGNPRNGEFNGVWQDYNNSKEGYEYATLR